MAKDKKEEKSKELAVTGGGQMMNPFQSPEQRIMNIEGMPRQWRADCSSNGGFKIGESGKVNEDMEMEILFFEDLPQTQLFPEQYDVSDWLVAYFVDNENQFSTCLFKGRSRENFIETYRSIQGQNMNLGTVKVVAVMKDKESELEKNGEKVKAKFKIVDFRFKSNSVERITELQDFWVGNNGTDGLYSNFISDIMSKAPMLKGVVRGEETEDVDTVEAETV
jgi:hypothetical protein